MNEVNRRILIKRFFLVLMISLISMLLLTVRLEAKSEYDSLTFDPEYYLKEYPDVNNAVNGDYGGAYNHFMTNGIKEGRSGSPYFDVEYYLNTYTDLQNAFKGDFVAAYNHFVTSGINENRTGSPYIDPAYYAKLYPDVKKAYGNDYRGIYYHFYVNGIKEGRRGSLYFDVDYYLKNNKDLLSAFGKGNYEAAFNHFLFSGCGELRPQSSDVNMESYLELYPDLQKAFGKNKDYKGLFKHCYMNAVKEERAMNHVHTIENISDVAPTCTENGQKGGKRCKTCGEIIEKPTVVQATGHKWGKATFTWTGIDEETNTAEETVKATATFTCENNSAHTESYNSIVTTETTQGNCSENGKVVYTATVKVGEKIYTDTKTIVTPLEESRHIWKEPTFVWDPNKTSAVATFVCSKNSKHIHDGVHAEISNVETPAECDKDGKITHTATVTLDGKTYTDKQETKIDKIGHKYGTPVFTWSGIDPVTGELTGGKVTAKATITCENNPNHTVTKEATIKSEDITDTENETTTKKYTATVTFSELSGTSFKDVVSSSPKGIPHEYGEPTWKWNDKDFTATATFTCKNNSAHVVTHNAKITPKVTKEATCTENGTTTYTATVEFNNKLYTCNETKTKNVPEATGHDWNMPEVTWTGIDEEANTVEETVKATAKFTCNNGCGTEHTVENLNATKTVSKVPTCTDTGIDTYTVTVTYEGIKDYKEHKQIIIPAKGHTWSKDKVTFNWSGVDTESKEAQNPTVKATFTCTTDGNHKETVDAVVTSNDTNAPTCTDKGTRTYTATATIGEGEKLVTATETKTQSIPAKGHTWGDNYDQDTSEGFKKKCSVCGELGNAEHLSTTFTVQKTTDVSDLTEENEYKAVSGETWNIDSLSAGSKGKVTGKVKFQKLTDENGEGYYIPVTVTIDGLDKVPSESYKTPTIEVTGAEKAYSITSNNSTTLLLKLDRKDCKSPCKGTVNCSCSSCNCEKTITITVDADGENGGYTSSNCTIDYCGAEFRKDIEVTFEYKNQNDELTTEKVTVEDGKVTVPEDLQNTENFGNDYHKFLYWSDENGNKKFDGNTSIDEITENAEFTSTYELNFDKFVEDVVEDLNNPDSNISEDYTGDFEVSKEGNTVTFDVKDDQIKLSELKNTTIPGAIAYVLNKGEVKDITLATQKSTGGEVSKKFTVTGVVTASLDPEVASLKEKIQTGAQALFVEALGSSQEEENMTLNVMALNGKGFTITVGDLDSKTKLPDNSNKKYTFNFTSDITTTTVTDENSLKTALTNGYKTIKIGKSFNVSADVEISKTVTITNDGSDYTITRSTNTGSVFDVKNGGNLTLTDVKLKGGTAGVTVSSGTLTASKLSYDEETYKKPAVRSAKSGATVNFTDSEGKVAVKLTTIEKITKYENIQEKPKGYGDKKETNSNYNYYNYYNVAEHSKIYKTTFHNHEGREFATFERYNYFGETVEQPDKTDFGVFYSFNYNAETYTLIGYAENRDKTVNFDYSSGDLPDGIIAPDGIKATADKYYYAAYKVTSKEGTKKVTDASGLRNAINDGTTSEIYINTTNQIDLSSEYITINRKLSIVGPAQTVKLKVKGIKITADNVFLHRLNIEFTPDSGTQELISTTGNKFTLWQCSLKNTGTPVNDAIKYSGTTAIVDVRWNTFDANNINNTFVNVDSALAGVTDIYGNTFKKLTKDNSKKSAIIIKDFDSSAKINGDDETVRISANTFDSGDYAIEILKEASGKEADISLETSQKIAIAVQCESASSSEDFSKIKFHVKNHNNIVKKYLNSSSSDEEISKPANVKDITVALETGIVETNISVPEAATIEGLKFDGDTYSGVISQSENGKFYLPVKLTSNDFEDRLSTVKVTDPNGNVNTYIYGSNSEDGIATVSNAKTMNLQLEAIKSSKITGSNGKVYKLELDPDGDKLDDCKVKEYTINYNGVETLEEKINKAAQNTLEANSFTVTKNNKINSYYEKFVYQYNKNDGLTYLKSNNGDNVEEYTFSVKYAGVPEDSSSLSVVARKKIENEQDSGIYLNDWVYVHPLKTGRAIQEVTMLTDVMGETPINAIDKVEQVVGKEHTYTVKLNRDKYNNWVTVNYLSNPSYTSKEWALTDIVTVDVVLDDSEQYIKSIKTHQASSANTFDVTFSDVDKTTIEQPTEFLAKQGTPLTQEQIKDFYEKGKEWWDKHVHENAYLYNQ